LYLGIEGKLNTTNSDGIGVWLNVTAQNGAPTGMPLAISGGGHYIGGNGGSNPNFKADFEVDYLFAFNTGGTNTTVYFDAGTQVGTPAIQYIGQTDQSGTPATGPATTGIFTANSITWAFDNSGNPLAGLEISIPFSELGITAQDSIQVFAFVVSNTAYFSDVTVPGNIGSGNPGFDPDFGGTTLNTPPNSGPYHTDLNAGVLPIEPRDIHTEIPQSFQLYQNYPNPFNPTTTILFSVPHVSRITLHVYDMAGRKVKTLIDGSLPASNHNVQWNGTNDAGQPVASGVYLYRLSFSPLELNTPLNPHSRGENKGVSQTRKMVLLR
ncbi:MAG: T9SS C-terminal target domain-containing protein, partial [Methanobacteriota archaeon]